MSTRDRRVIEADARTDTFARRLLADICEEAGQQAEADRHRALAEQMARSHVIMATSAGDILLALDRERAPLTAANFLGYVDEGFYDGTIFHRVIDGFMIQGGGFLPGMIQKTATRPPVKNETPNGLSNRRGTLALARAADLDSGTCQFYINVVDNSAYLDKERHCVFGHVTAGMDVVDRIKAVPTRTGDAPREDVIIVSARRIV
jgi:cyclophilin family peptidyl-prolyl cis-trans isomerase